ncbi:isochorismatase family protein [Phenylobacterium sp.]|uniref:isochorismatase family protein n=1 Tax=Phenylobacterium sp. TaxID=1871053 RepID=UPI002FC83BF6
MPRAALLIIDAQIALLQGAYLADDVVAAIDEALRRARDVKAPVVYLRHCHASFAPMMKGAGTWEIDPRVAPQDGDVVIDKRASDGFWETALEATMRDLEVSRVVVAGLQTEFCVDATCRAALSKGFDITLVADGHTTGDAVTDAATTIRHHNYALTRLAHPECSVVAQRAAELEFG